MADLIIGGELADRLREMAEQEQRSVEETLKSLLDERDEELSSDEGEALQAMLDTFDKRAAETSLLEAFIGMFDDIDATDLSERIQNMSRKEVLLAMDGMFDDDITDLSNITKEDVMEAYRKKYDDAD